ncbi:glycoside hydrolase family 127 protein [Marisediminicola sp. LYQ85]|uniref:glycoside hydrolase family 127 protein n=1 Tax=Marisediminicola sp. LYQ85 TaxID=3391062 RepID=UPI0039839565
MTFAPTADHAARPAAGTGTGTNTGTKTDAKTPTATDGPVSPTRRDSTVFRPLGHSAVSLTNGFLSDWQRTNRVGTIPHAIDQLEVSQALNNIRRVTGEHDGEFVGFQFADSDVYKTLEAIGWEAGRSDVTELMPFVESTIDLLTRAQQPDGYLNSHYQVDKADLELAPGELRWGHELYCLGHLLQAGVAWARTTGRRDLLDIGLRFAALVDERYGPEGERGVDGHAEIETALVETYRVTGDERWLTLARRFIDLRGHQLVGPDPLGYPYFQEHEPIRSVTEATGHAVRQLYLAAGAADVVTETGDADLEAALERIWSSVHEHKMYISGGTGSRHRDEAFGDAYELPPDRSYSETCAAIANFQWNWRMLLLTGQSRFADEMERGLFNAIAVSTATDGCSFTYANPLQLRTAASGGGENAPARRQPWFRCACCPPNLARLVSSLHDYVATTSEHDLQIHLFTAGTIALGEVGGAATTATVSTDYPSHGTVTIDFDAPFDGGSVLLRQPGWATDTAGDITVTVDGRDVSPLVRDGYLVIEARDAPISSIRLSLPLEPVVRRPHPFVDASRGTIAVTRGPILFAIEQADLPEGVTPEEVVVPEHPTVTVAEPDPVLGTRISIASARQRPGAGVPLYSTSLDVDSLVDPTEFDLIAIPYHRWGNRSEGGMRVWLPTS